MGTGEVMGSDHGDRLTPLVHGSEGTDGDLFAGVGGWRAHGGVGAASGLLI